MTRRTGRLPSSVQAALRPRGFLMCASGWPCDTTEHDLVVGQPRPRTHRTLAGQGDSVYSGTRGKHVWRRRFAFLALAVVMRDWPRSRIQIRIYHGIMSTYSQSSDNNLEHLIESASGASES